MAIVSARACPMFGLNSKLDHKEYDEQWVKAREPCDDKFLETTRLAKQCPIIIVYDESTEREKQCHTEARHRHDDLGQPAS